MLPDSAPILHGEGLTLRPHFDADAGLIREAGRDPYITAVTTVPAAPEGGEASDADIRAYLRRQHSRLPSGHGVQLVIVDEGTGEAVGQVGLVVKDEHRAALGYWVAPPFRRRGYAARAARVFSEWALTLPGLLRLEASVEPWNEGSLRAVAGAGFAREGLAVNWELVNGEPRDMVIFSRTP